jgi:hypothetical protein
MIILYSSQSPSDTYIKRVKLFTPFTDILRMNQEMTKSPSWEYCPFIEMCICYIISELLSRSNDTHPPN